MGGHLVSSVDGSGSGYLSWQLRRVGGWPQFGAGVLPGGQTLSRPAGDASCLFAGERVWTEKRRRGPIRDPQSNILVCGLFGVACRGSLVCWRSAAPDVAVAVDLHGRTQANCNQVKLSTQLIRPACGHNLRGRGGYYSLRWLRRAVFAVVLKTVTDGGSTNSAMLDQCAQARQEWRSAVMVWTPPGPGGRICRIPDCPSVEQGGDRHGCYDDRCGPGKDRVRARAG
jgi:hypothetical protein